MKLTLKMELAYLSPCMIAPVGPSSLLLISADFSHEVKVPLSRFVRVKVSWAGHNAVIRNMWNVNDIWGSDE